MASAAISQAFRTVHSHGYTKKSRDLKEVGGVSFRPCQKGFKIDAECSVTLCHGFETRARMAIRASASQTPVADQVLTPSKGDSTDPQKKSSMSLLIILLLKFNMLNTL